MTDSVQGKLVSVMLDTSRADRVALVMVGGEMAPVPGTIYAHSVLTRAEVIEVRDQLVRWLKNTPGDEASPNQPEA